MYDNYRESYEGGRIEHQILEIGSLLSFLVWPFKSTPKPNHAFSNFIWRSGGTGGSGSGNYDGVA